MDEGKIWRWHKKACLLFLLNVRRSGKEHFGITHLPKNQFGKLYAPAFIVPTWVRRILDLPFPKIPGTCDYIYVLIKPTEWWQFQEFWNIGKYVKAVKILCHRKKLQKAKVAATYLTFEIHTFNVRLQPTPVLLLFHYSIRSCLDYFSFHWRNTGWFA